MSNKNEKNIIILSHDNPDVDSIISGYLLSKYLNNIGILSEYVILDKRISKEVNGICNKYNINPYDYIKEIDSDSNIYLVDHHETNAKRNIVGIIDHHPTISIINAKEYLNKESSSTAMLIYNLDPKIFDKEDILKVIVANLIDTNCFTSTKTVNKDKLWTIDMCNKYGFDYNKLLDECSCLTDVSNINEAALNGEKTYHIDNYIIKSTYIQIKAIDKNKINGIIKILIEETEKQKIDLWIFILHDMNKLESIIYYIKDGKYKTEKNNRIVSRGNTIIPNIEKRIMKEKNCNFI